jgi:predicted transcriptional regulator
MQKKIRDQHLRQEIENLKKDITEKQTSLEAKFEKLVKDIMKGKEPESSIDFEKHVTQIYEEIEQDVLNMLDRTEAEPVADEEIPDFKSLGTFRVDRILQESAEDLQLKDSKLEFGSVTLAVNVMEH